MSTSTTQARLEARFATSIYHWRVRAVQVPLSTWNNPLQREELLSQTARSGMNHYLLDEPTSGNTQLVWLARRGQRK